MKPLNQYTFAEVLELLRRVDKRTWIAIGSISIVSLLILFFFVVPAWIERPLLRRDIQSMEGQIRQVNALSQKRVLWEENQKIFGDLIDKTQSRLLSAEDLGMLLGKISKIGSVSRIEVLTSKPLPEKTTFPAPYDLKYQASGYEFTFLGGYHDLANLVSRIESHEKLLRIKSFQIAPSEKTLDRHTAELKLWAIMKTTPAAALPAGASHAKK